MTKSESIASLMTQRLIWMNSVANRLSLILAALFCLLTILDGLHIFKCGWFWTSVASVSCLFSYFLGRNRQSVILSSLATLLLILGFSVGLTPFVATFLIHFQGLL